MKQWWDRVGVEEGEAIENRMLTRVIENAQKKVEGRNFDIRKHLLDYDNVMNKQRHAFYARRLAAMNADDKAIDEEIQACIEGFVADLLGRTWPQRGEPEDDQYVEMAHAFEAQFGVAFSIERSPFERRTASVIPRVTRSDTRSSLDRVGPRREARRRAVLAEETYADLEGYPTFHRIVRDLQLQILDQQWKAHLHTMDSLRGGINMRAYAQRDPKLEYQREGFALFGEMEHRIDETLAEYALKFSFPRPQTGPQATQRRVDGNAPQQPPKPQSQGGEPPPTPGGAAARQAPRGRHRSTR